jgi:formylglycine-generating enzyme required for sulfatase activity
MKFTPLGKFLLFLVGLAIIATAVRLYVPKDKLPWPKKSERRADEPRRRPDDTTESQVGRQTEKGREEKPNPAPASDPWARVPAGLFASGPEAAEVDVPAFSIQRSEVTNGEYAAFLEACPLRSACGPKELPSYWEDRTYVAKFPMLPVVFVSWNEAAAYCRWAGARLPTALEWEKAARGTDGRAYPTGETLEPADVNILGTQRRDEKGAAPKQIASWPVDGPKYRRDKSPFGVYAMAGNVSEWTSSASPDEPDLRIVAGGSWDSWELADGRTYQRLPKDPEDRSSSLGFRCAKSN